MINKNLVREFPAKRIKPVDGLAVTAQIWEEAHEYHRQRHRLHDLLRHGPGIVAGLEVIASDPPDSSVYILPGVAVDPRGETIIIPEPVAYDVGPAHGLLYLALSYEESRPMQEQDDGASYVHAQFGIEAALAMPDSPSVELARIRREDRDTPIVDASSVEFPEPNAIDQRFRQTSPWAGAAAQAAPPQAASIAVCYAGDFRDSSLGHGAGVLARSLRHAGRPVWVDDDIPLAPGLESYTLVYLVGHKDFELGRDEMNALYSYLQDGGTVLIESCRKQSAGGGAVDSQSPPSDTSFSALLASMGIELSEPDPGDGLLVEPHLFAVPPPGYETETPPQVLVGKGVILTTCDYGCLWRGERRGRAATREEIRTSVEWGENVVVYAVKRLQRARSK